MADDVIGQINPDGPGGSGFKLILNLLELFYKSNGDAAYTDIANSLLRHIHMDHVYDVKVSPEDGPLNKIRTALGSVEMHLSQSASSQP